LSSTTERLFKPVEFGPFLRFDLQHRCLREFVLRVLCLAS
jgi:hypothetical protein